MDTKRDRYEMEMFEFFHFLIFPYRVAKFLLGLVIMGVIALVWFFYVHGIQPIVNDIGWTINRGAYSQRAREYAVFESNYMAYQVNHGNLVGNDPHYGNDAQTYVIHIGWRDHDNDAYQVDTTLPINLNPDDSHPGQKLYFSTKLPGWDLRPDAIFMRKSARMLIAYDNGMIGSNAVLTTVTAIKLHLNPQDVLKHLEGRLSHPDPDAKYLAAHGVTLDEWRSVSSALVAPNFELYVNYGPIARDMWGDQAFGSVVSHYEDAEAPRYGIRGMCIASACSDADKDYFVTGKDDIFAENPPLSAGQEQAETALNSMMSEGVWLETAHQNGIHDDKAVLGALAMVQSYLAEQRKD